MVDPNKAPRSADSAFELVAYSLIILICIYVLARSVPSFFVPRGSWTGSCTSLTVEYWRKLAGGTALMFRNFRGWPTLSGSESVGPLLAFLVRTVLSRYLFFLAFYWFTSRLDRLLVVLLQLKSAQFPDLGPLTCLSPALARHTQTKNLHLVQNQYRVPEGPLPDSRWKHPRRCRHGI